MTNLTRERIRQVEVKGLARMAAHRDIRTLGEFAEPHGENGKRRLPVLGAERIG